MRRRQCRVWSLLLLLELMCGLADLGHMQADRKAAGERLTFLLDYTMLPGQQPPNHSGLSPSLNLCQPGTNIGLLLLVLICMLAVAMDSAYGGPSSLQGQMEPKMATVGSKRKNPSSAKQKSPATKRSWKEGEPEPPMLPEEIMEDPRGVVEMLLMMAGDVEPNPGPTIADVEEYSPEQAFNWLCGVTKGISTASLKIMEDKDISGRSLLGYVMLAGSNAINTLKEVLQVKDGEAAAIAYALKRLVDGNGSKHDVQMKVIESSEEEGQIVDKDAEPMPVGEERYLRTMASEAITFSGTLNNEEVVEWLRVRLSEKQITLTKQQIQTLKESGINGKLCKQLLPRLLQHPRQQVAISELVESLTFEVRATYHGVKRMKGIRASMYRYAEQHKACYSPEYEKSIWYDNGNDDLQIALVFKNEELALTFLTFLAQLYLSNPSVKQDDISVRQEVEVVYVADLKYVRLEQYVGSEYESPIQSLEEFSGVRSVHSSLSMDSCSGPLAQFQCLEVINSNTFPYRCHIKPKSKFKLLASNESNMIAASWLFHQYFDGLNTQDVVSGMQNVPLIALKADPHEEPKDEVVGTPPQKRARVSLLLECRSSDVHTDIGTLLKTGSERVSDLVWKTFIHVSDAKTFCDCLDWKYKETHRMWETDADSQ